MPVYIVMLGAPGAGKGTQANLISKKIGLPHVSSGNIFRENLKNNTELGKMAAEYMNRGDLVPDDVTIAMIRERLSREDAGKGAILDGFPRTPTQADALGDILADFDGKVDVVPYIKVDKQVLIERLTGRWTCKENGHIYHEQFNPPEKSGVCDIDGSDLYQREDDSAETVITRIQVYLEQTAPLIEHYTQAGVVKEIRGEQLINKVTEDLLANLPLVN